MWLARPDRHDVRQDEDQRERNRGEEHACRQPPPARKASREQHQDREDYREADHLPEQAWPLGKQPAHVALLLEPVAPTPPERDQPERQADPPEDERRHGADHLAAPRRPAPP